MQSLLTLPRGRRIAAGLISLALLLGAVPARASRESKQKEKEAEEAAARANALTDRPESLFSQALEAAEKNDWPRAHSYIDQAILKVPTNDQYVYAKAWFYYKAGVYDKALELAKKAETMNGEVGAAQHLQGMIYTAQAKPEEAEKLFSKLCLDPNFVRNADSCGNLGELYIRIYKNPGDPAAKKAALVKAGDAFIRLVDLNSKDPRSHYYLGWIASEMGQWSEAASRCNTAFTLAEQLGYGNNFLPSYGPLYALCAAKAYLKMNDVYRAKELITEACRISPSANDCHEGEVLLINAGQ